MLRFLRALGPGLVTGASDDDPSGIATYSQVGAQFGLGMLWTMIFSYPLMTAVQVISARIGRITGHGIAGSIRHHYPRWLLYSTVSLLLVAACRCSVTTRFAERIQTELGILTCGAGWGIPTLLRNQWRQVALSEDFGGVKNSRNYRSNSSRTSDPSTRGRNCSGSRTRY